MIPRETVLGCLQTYADRGIFRGFGASVDRNGNLECRFLWHAQEPHLLRFDQRRRALVFVDLLPGVPYPSEMDRALRAYVAGRSREDLPEHRRLDPGESERRLPGTAPAPCRSRCAASDGDFEYVATRAVKLVNEVFLDFLAGPWDGYMIEHFGAPEE